MAFENGEWVMRGLSWNDPYRIRTWKELVRWVNEAGFLPLFANCRREGYDFDARWEDGKASRREKRIMDFFIGQDEEGDNAFQDVRILSTDLKEQAGFGKQGEKNYQGIMTQLQMETYLVVSGFDRRKNKKGAEYGMAVSIPLPPETIWGYDRVTSAYTEKPVESWERIYAHVQQMYPSASDAEISRMIGKKPEE